LIERSIRPDPLWGLLRLRRKLQRCRTVSHNSRAIKETRCELTALVSSCFCILLLLRFLTRSSRSFICRFSRSLRSNHFHQIFRRRRVDFDRCGSCCSCCRSRGSDGYGGNGGRLWLGHTRSLTTRRRRGRGFRRRYTFLGDIVRR